jgi:hypothetical protein
MHGHQRPKYILLYNIALSPLLSSYLIIVGFHLTQEIFFVAVLQIYRCTYTRAQQ